MRPSNLTNLDISNQQLKAYINQQTNNKQSQFKNLSRDNSKQLWEGIFQD